MRLVTLLFDFDGTLVRLDKRNAYLQVALAHGLRDASSLAESLYQLDNCRCAQGKPDRRPVFEKYIGMFRIKNVEKLCADFWKYVEKGQILQPDCRQTLDALKAQGYDLVCVTDTDGTGGNKLNRVRAAVQEHFPDDRILIGTETEGIPYHKDGTKGYVKAVVAKLQVDPTRCVMIGDKVKVDLEPAQEVGMQTILVRNDEYPGEWDRQVERFSDLVLKLRRLESNSHR